MSLHITASDHGRIDVFSVDLPMPQATAFANDHDELTIALGARPDPAQIDVFDTALMGDMGLAGYLQQGMGVSAADISPFAQELGDIDQAVIIRAAGFGGKPTTLTPHPPLNHVATFYEADARIDLTPLQSISAAGHLPPVDQPAPTASNKTVWLWVCLALLVTLLVAAVLPVLLSV